MPDRCLVLVLLVLLCLTAATAQENAELTGTVTDPTGAVIPNATITLTNTAPAKPRPPPATAPASITFSNLNHGTYSMKVEAKGFNSYKGSNIVLNVAADRAGKC